MEHCISTASIRFLLLMGLEKNLLLWCSGHPATPTNSGNEVSSSTSSRVSPTWSSSWNFPLPVLRLNSSWLVVRLHFAFSKTWIADYLESRSIRFSHRVYKAERFHEPASSSTSPQAEQNSIPPCYSPREILRSAYQKPTDLRAELSVEPSYIQY